VRNERGLRGFLKPSGCKSSGEHNHSCLAGPVFYQLIPVPRTPHASHVISLARGVTKTGDTSPLNSNDGVAANTAGDGEGEKIYAVRERRNAVWRCFCNS
jgi:hypothetical protein